MKEEIKKWLEQAKADFDTAKVNLKGKRYYAVVLFCQQCLEKALKALWLKELNKEFPYVHDLTLFMRRLKLPKKFENICKDLTTAYAEVRYPTDAIPFKKFSKQDAVEMLEETKGALEWIKKKISSKN